jgi:hypothetical protein
MSTADHACERLHVLRLSGADLAPLLAQAEAVANLAEVLELDGRRDEAVEAYQIALELHAKKSNKLGVRRTTAAIEALGRSSVASPEIGTGRDP